jgi:hypothetical protein
MNKQDYRDYFVLGIVTAGWVAATVFLFWYPSSVNFATWAGLVATIGGVYHWLCVNDDKRVDAGNVAAVLPSEGLTDVAGNLQREWKGEDHGAA